jgi:hypothetical protein
MANDPGLAGDTCIFMEATSGDGGTHNPNGTWWLSPDISLVGPTSGPDKADPGQVNPVQVNFHRKAAQSNCVFSGGESITVELWVGNPSLAMTPDNPASTFRVLIIGSPLPPEGGSGVQPIDWTPPQGLPPNDPQSSGHKCLIARCYPDNLTPSSTNFFVPDDQHVAQHNICIVPCGGPGAARRPGPCGFSVATVNPHAKKAQRVTLRAVLDLKPNDFVRKTVLTRAKRVQGFHELATEPPHGFKFELRDFPKAEVTDHSHGGGHPSFEARVELAPAQFTHIEFVADLSGGQLGAGYIFHLTQTGADGHPQGGLTLVMVAV